MGPRRVVSCSTRAGLGGSSARRLAAGALARHTSGLCAAGQAAGPHDALADCTAATCGASLRARTSQAHAHIAQRMNTVTWVRRPTSGAGTYDVGPHAGTPTDLPRADLARYECAG